MNWKPLPLVGGSNPDDAEPYCAQEYINWLPAAAETPGTRADWMLKTPPGLQHCLTVTEDTRWRAMRNVEGRLFGVVGQSFVQCFPDEGSYSVLGTIPGGSRCSITHNQITNGNEVVIGNGNAGYVYNTVNGVFGPITDNGFPGFLLCDYINSLIVGIEPKRRFFFNSAVAAATSYSTINRFESEASPDRLRSLIVDHRELWLLNERTVEVFAHTGNLTAIFENKQIVIEQGCAATHSVCKLDNSVFWLSDRGQVFRAVGYTPQRISTRAMEQKIARCDMSKAFAFTWVDRGFAVYYLTFPDGETWGYDCAASARAGFPVWHKRRSTNMDRWRLSTLVEWDGNWYGGEYNSGRLFRLDWDYAAEGADDLTRVWRPGVLHADQNRVRLHGLEFVFDTGHVSAGQAIVVSPSLADGIVDTAYTAHQYVQAGGTTSGTFSISEGALPTGLSMTSGGLVTGTPTAGGVYDFTVRYTDANGNTGELVEEVIISYRFPVLLSALSRWSGSVSAPVAWTDSATIYADYGSNAGVPGAAASRTGRFLCAPTDSADTTPQLYRWSNGAYNLLTITGTAIPAYNCVCFSPDENWCFITSGGDIYAYEYNGTGFTHRVTYTTGVNHAESSLACSSDFRIARSGTGKRVAVWQFNTSAYTFTLLGESSATVSFGQEDRTLDWHPDGRYLAAGNVSSVYVYDTSSYPMSAVTVANACASGVFWNTAGTYLYTINQSGPVRAYTWDGAALTAVTSVSYATASGTASMNSARTHLACVGNTNEIRVFTCSGATITDGGNIDTAATNPVGAALFTNLTNGLPE